MINSKPRLLLFRQGGLRQHGISPRNTRGVNSGYADPPMRIGWTKTKFNVNFELSMLLKLGLSTEAEH